MYSATAITGNPATGTQYLPARTYDPGQGRFLSPDAAGQLNRYQAFDTNPITNTDPTGQTAVPQILIDAFTAILCIAMGVITAGGAVPVLAAAAAGEEIAATAIASAVINTVSAATNIAAGATSATLTANDAADLSGHGFLTASQKEDLNTATFALGVIANATNATATATDLYAKASEEAATAAHAFSTGSLVDHPQPLAAGEPGAAVNPAAEVVNPAAEGVNPDPQVVPAEVNPGAAVNPGAEVNPGQAVVSNDAVEAVNPNVNLNLNGADPPVVQFGQELQAAGQNLNINPEVQQDTVAEQVPGNLQDTNPALVPEGPPNTPPDQSGTAGLASQLTQQATEVVDHEVNSNIAAGSPGPQVNPLGENTSTSNLGFMTSSGLNSNGLQEGF